MGFFISKPSSILSEFVKHYWAVESSIPKGEEHIQRIVPAGLMELIFYLNEKPKSSDKNKSINENTLITGQLSGYYDIKVAGKLSLFSIVFQPHGLSMFFDIPLNELYNRNVPLKFILKDNVNKLEDELLETQSFTERVMIVERFLFERLQKSKKEYEFSRVKNSIIQINNTKGLISIDSLASIACLSRKQYERTFGNFIGTSPKQFLKIVRFQNAINQKSKNKDTTLTTLAYKCGYYDQSHMIKDFMSLAGVTPKQYFKDYEPYSDYFG